MKKQLIAALASLFVMSVGATAFADPIDIDGSVSYQFRQNQTGDANKIDNNIFKFVMNGTVPNFAPNTSVYFRVGGESFNNPLASTGDFAPYQGSNPSDAFALDQFGFNYANGGFNYKLGRQAIGIGATSLIYDATGWVGRHEFSDGLVVTGKSGATALTFGAVQQSGYIATDFDNNFTNVAANKMYWASANENFTSNWALGATLARLKQDGSDAQRNWAVNTSYTLGKTVLAGEYSKSNISDLNKAYDYGITYNVDGKNTVSATYFKVEADADFLADTTFDNNQKGMYYDYNHQFSKSTAFNLFYKSNKTLDTDTKKTSLRGTVSYSF